MKKKAKEFYAGFKDPNYSKGKPIEPEGGKLADEKELIEEKVHEVHERMSKVELEGEEQEATFEKLVEFLLTGKTFFHLVDVMCEKEDSDEVVGILFTNYPALLDAVSNLDIEVIIQKDQEKDKIKENTSALIDKLVQMAMENGELFEDDRQFFKDEAEMVKKSIEVL